MHEYRGGLTLVQAIMNAGGFKNTGRQKEVVLIRRTQDGKPAGTIVDCKSILRGYQVDKDVELAPYDIVYVPRKHIADVNMFVEQYINANIPRLEGWWWAVYEND
jgi:protein involved in polysaccharide export with SLBB domain